jgi:hypothetical protein
LEAHFETKEIMSLRFKGWDQALFSSGSNECNLYSPKPVERRLSQTPVLDKLVELGDVLSRHAAAPREAELVQPLIPRPRVDVRVEEKGEDVSGLHSFAATEV